MGQRGVGQQVEIMVNFLPVAEEGMARMFIVTRELHDNVQQEETAAESRPLHAPPQIFRSRTSKGEG
jgi:hypothetical protein